VSISGCPPRSFARPAGRVVSPTQSPTLSTPAPVASDVLARPPVGPVGILE